MSARFDTLWDGPNRLWCGVFALAILAGTQPPDSQAQETLHPGWSSVTVGSGVKPALDFDADDHIHIMGMTETPGGLVWHASATTAAGPWSPTPVAEGYFYGPGDLRVDQLGRAHLAWHSHDNEAPQHVMVATDGTVSSHILASPGQHDGWDNSLFVDPAGTVHMACVDPSPFGAVHSLQYGSFDGVTWSFDSAVPGSGSFMYGLNTSIAIDPDGKAHVLYCQSADWVADGALVHAIKAPSGWTFDPIDTGVGVGRFPSLAIDQAGNLHATWLDVDAVGQTTGTVQYASLGAGGDTWQVTPVITLDALSLGFSGARKSTSIAVDQNGIPHIAFADTRTVSYAVLEPGEGWRSTTILDHPAGIYRSLAVLRLDSTGRPAIAIWQSIGGDDSVRLLRQLPDSAPGTSIDLGLAVTATAGEAVQITYTTAGAGTYQLQWSPDLESWSDLGSAVIAGPAPVPVSASDVGGPVRRYYRVRYSTP